MSRYAVKADGSDLVLNVKVADTEALPEGYRYVEDRACIAAPGLTISDEDLAGDPPAPDVWAEIRAVRNLLLTACDWTQAGDSPLTTEGKAAWATYRQALRDIPETYAETGPGSVIWPDAPA